LRIDSHKPAESLMRIRAVYAIGVMMIISQVISMAVMYATYERWTYDHTITSIACLAVFGLLLTIRYCKNVAFYAAIYSLLILGGTAASALPDNAGINSAMLPVLAIAPAMCAFMAGRRAAIAFYAAASALIIFLFWISITHPPQMVSGDYNRETNRLVQGSFAMTLSTLLSVFISERIYLLAAELREAAERARKAEAATADFLAKMSHEMRTPLNGVIGLAEALRRKDIGESERRLAQTIERSSNSLLRILNDVLDLSKIQAGKLAIEMRSHAPRAIAGDVVESWRENAAGKGLSLSCEISEATPEHVMIDDLRVTQILQNLVSNAVKFTDQGAVRLSLDSVPLSAGRWRLEFRVSDTGPGIDQSRIEQIFDRFEQGKAGTARRYGGTGLGLPICRELASLMGGRVSVESANAQGATFLFALTVDEADRVAADSSDADSAALDYQPLRVLVAEDNEVNRLVINELLKSLGVQAAFVEEGRSCIEAASLERFDVIFIDKEMPVLDGLEAARIIRASGGPSAAAAIVAVTGDGALQDDPGFNSSGIDDWIVKPITLKILSDALRRATAGRVAA